VATDDYLIGLDIGSSSVKATAISTRDFSVLGSARATTVIDRRRDLVETPADDLRASVDSALSQLVTLFGRGRPVGIATTSYGESGAHVSAAGEVLRPPIFWQDQRSEEQVTTLVGRIGADRLDALVGHAPDPTWGIGRIMWVSENEPAVMEQTAHWLPIADLANFWLTGMAATSPGLAARLMAVDQQSGAWSDEVLGAAGLDRAILPPIHDSGTVIGELTAEASLRTGLPVGLPVCVGGHDRQCGTYAAGGPRREPVDSAGTAEGVLVPRLSGSDERRELCSGIARYRDVVPGSVTYAGRLGLAGGLLEWASRCMFDDAPDVRAVVAGVQVPHRFNGIVCVPTMGRYASPFWAPGPVPSVMHGMSVRHSRADMVQAFLEAPAYSLRATLDLLDAWLDRRTESFRVEGGLVASEAALQVRADITGRTVEAVLQPDVGAVGSALLAGVGTGVFADYSEPLDAFRPAILSVQPDPRRALEYSTAYEDTWLPAAAFARDHRPAAPRA
jgi:xylulokinase